MRVMIIGSEGYLGTALVGALRGPRFDLNLVDACLWDQIPTREFYRPRGPNQLLWHIDHHQPEVVVYLAALAHDWQGRLNPAHVHYANAVLPALVAKWALDRGRRFVGISSYSIFTKGADIGAYPASKRKLEEWLLDLELWRGINLVRFGTLFGHTEHSRVDSFRPHLLLNSMMLDAVAGGVIKIPDRILNRPVTCLDDAVAAVRRAIEAPVPGTVENVHLCSGTLRQFAEAVQEVVPGTRIEETQACGANDTRDYSFSPSIKCTALSLQARLHHLKGFIEENKEELMARRQSAWEPMLLRAGRFYGG